MDFLSFEFLSALLSIIFIDLVLAGDNALLIGLVAKNLPKQQQKSVIFWGTFSAIFVRVVLTLVAVKLLQYDGLLLVGGILLVYISYKLVLTETELDNIKPGKRNFWGAIGTIILADILMGVDNIIAVAGAAHGHPILVVIGLIISIPIVIWGSTLVMNLIDRFPIIITLGSAILAWTASKMIVKDAYTASFFHSKETIYQFELVLVLMVVAIGLTVKYFTRRKTAV